MEQKEVVINSCEGGFGLSAAGMREYARLSGFEVFAYATPPGDFSKYVRIDGSMKGHDRILWLKTDVGPEFATKNPDPREYIHDWQIDRDDPNLVQTIKTLGHKANGRNADLKIISIPADVEFYIDDNAGSEWVEEKHRTWS